MRLAALYDVHGNVHGLEAVLAEVEADTTVLFGGDLASGPFPRETIDLARSVEKAVFILGNADVLASPAMNPQWDAARRWVESQLDDERITWLASLPFSWRADDTLYVHANPVDVDGVVHEWTPQEELVAYVADVRESRIVTGHVHMQWERRVDSVRWVCAGSVGMPYEDAPGAYWTLLDGEDFEFRRTEYDLERAAATTRESGHPLAEELAAENILRVPSRDEARAFLTA